MKILKFIGWSSAVLGTILILLGIISQLFKINLFHVQHNSSLLIAANSFLLLAIAIFIVTKKCCESCCCKDDK